jgi:hypothetical protein
MARHGVANIGHTRLRARFRDAFLLDTNGRLQEHSIHRNSFKTTKSTNFYSIQIDVSTRYKLTVANSRPARRLVAHNGSSRSHLGPRAKDVQLDRELQCYISTARFTNLLRPQADHQSRVTNRTISMANRGISNRHSKLLEFAATHTKQTSAVRSNRHVLPVVAPGFQLSTVNRELCWESQITSCGSPVATHESPLTFNAGTLPASGVNSFRSV